MSLIAKKRQGLLLLAAGLAAAVALIVGGCGGDDNSAVPVTKYAVVVSSAGAGSSGGGNYAANATVTIKAGTPPTGQQFANWYASSGNVVFADDKSATTTFTMPTYDVTVTAYFEPIPTYTVTLTSAGSGASGAGSYPAGERVTITAGTATGLTFSNWTSASDSVTFANANNAATTFTMPAVAVTVKATFVLSDTRDGKTYKAVKIGSKTWMGENLNYQPTSGNFWCYENNESNCDKYGKLYDWNTAKTVCPTGWHLPSRAEWNDLVTAVGSSAGTKLKSKTGWTTFSGTPVGTDELGFSALPAGRRYPAGQFQQVDYYGDWWTATENGGSNAYARNMFYDNERVGEYYDGKENGISVRCVGD